jgi:cardiolipin synthase
MPRGELCTLVSRLLRLNAMRTRLIVHLPNVISLARLLLVPFAIAMIVHSHWRDALVVFAVAGVSDAIDGFIAQRFELRSALGAYLDPLADKALLVSIYVTLALVSAIPALVALLVVARDAMIVAAVVRAWLADRRFVVQPLYISKLNTAAQIGVAALVLAAKAFGWNAQGWITVGLALVVSLTGASAVAYLIQWSRRSPPLP